MCSCWFKIHQHPQNYDKHLNMLKITTIEIKLKHDIGLPLKVALLHVILRNIFKTSHI